MIKPFERLRSSILMERRIFRFREDEVVNPRTGRVQQVTVIEGNDWCNIIPVTTEGDVVLVRQWRHGTREPSLEIPGGIVESGEDPALAAARELLEETGYQAQEVLPVGKVASNSAIFTNTTHTYLAPSISRAQMPRPDEGEDLEVVMRPLRQIPELIASGEINHSLVVAAFYHLAILAGGRLGVLPPR